jgi:RNA polymerase sigma-70 factor (ECF subfamily)
VDEASAPGTDRRDAFIIADTGRTRRRQVQWLDKRLAEAFAAALLAGDHATLVRLVAPGVVLTSDGGPDVHGARRPVVGRDRVLRMLANLTRRLPPEVTLDWVRVNESRGLVVRLAGSVAVVLQVEVHGGVVTAVRAVANPRKLQAVERPVHLR